MGHHPLPAPLCLGAATIGAASSPGAAGGGSALQQGQPQILLSQETSQETLVLMAVPQLMKSLG